MPESKVLVVFFIITLCALVEGRLEKHILHCDHFDDYQKNPEEVLHLVVKAKHSKYLNKICMEYIEAANHLISLEFVGYQNVQAHLEDLLENKIQLRILGLEKSGIHAFRLNVLDNTPNLYKLKLSNNSKLYRLIGSTTAEVQKLSARNTAFTNKSIKLGEYKMEMLKNADFSGSNVNCMELNDSQQNKQFEVKQLPNLKRCKGKSQTNN